MRYARWVGLFVASLVLGVSGGVEAAGLITGKQVKDNSVASIDVRNGSLTSPDVKNSGLGPADYDRDITGDKGDDGSQGPQGFPGVRKVSYQQVVGVALDPGNQTQEIPCASPTQFAIAGGIETSDDAVAVRASAPGGEDGTFARSWYLRLYSDAPEDIFRTLYAVCVTA